MNNNCSQCNVIEHTQQHKFNHYLGSMLAHSTLHQCDIVTSKVTLMYLSWHCERCEMASIGL